MFRTIQDGRTAIMTKMRKVATDTGVGWGLGGQSNNNGNQKE